MIGGKLNRTREGVISAFRQQLAAGDAPGALASLRAMHCEALDETGERCSNEAMHGGLCYVHTSIFGIDEPDGAPDPCDGAMNEAAGRAARQASAALLPADCGLQSDALGDFAAFLMMGDLPDALRTLRVENAKALERLGNPAPGTPKYEAHCALAWRQVGRLVLCESGEGGGNE